MSMQKIVLTTEQERYLREHFPTEAACDIAEHLHISDTTVRNIAREMGLKKSESFDPRRFHNHIVKTYKHERYRNFVA